MVGSIDRISPTFACPILLAPVFEDDPFSLTCFCSFLKNQLTWELEVQPDRSKVLAPAQHSKNTFENQSTQEEKPQLGENICERQGVTEEGLLP